MSPGSLIIAKSPSVRRAFYPPSIDGHAILAKVANLRLEGLLDGDEISQTLHAAVWADALRKGQSPRQILDALWENMPSDEQWERLRELVGAALDAHDFGIEAEAA